MSTCPTFAEDEIRCHQHLASFEAFTTNLSDALQESYPHATSGPSKYEQVEVLFVSWEETDVEGLDNEIEALKKVFREDYGFGISSYKITGGRRASINISQAVSDFRLRYEKENVLLIVYYAGHGCLDNTTVLLSGSEDFKFRIASGNLTGTLDDLEGDLLVMYDCCAAAGSFPRLPDSTDNLVEALVACGFEADTPRPAPGSFTNTLTNVLRDWKALTFTVPQLHGKVLSQLQGMHELQFTATPVFLRGSNCPTTGHIQIRSLLGGQSGDRPDRRELVALRSDDITYQTPRVLFSLSLRQETNLSQEDWMQWIKDCPGLINEVHIEAKYMSNPLLLILSVPVPVWDRINHIYTKNLNS